MNCEYAQQQLIDWLDKEMPENERWALEQHFNECKACEQEIKNTRHVMELMNQLPVPKPSFSMQARFHGMLDAYQQSEQAKIERPGLIEALGRLWNIKPAFKLAYSIALLIAGIAVGFLLNRQKDNGSENQVAALSAQVEEMKQIMLLSLLENPSASERLKAVSYTDEITTVNNKIVEALLTTLNEDPNVNVRLMTLEALVKFSSLPRVREGLVQSITQQESPLMQSAIADVMVKLQEKRSVKPLQQLLDRKDLNESIKTKIKASIHQLI
jgi:uncharacterized protein (UPF0333 family)